MDARPGGGGDVPAQRRARRARGRGEADLRRGRQARAPRGGERDGAVEAERERLRKEIARSREDARERALRRRTRRPRSSRRSARSSSATAVSSRRSTADAAASAGSRASRPGPRSSGSGACRRCSPTLGDPQRALPAIHVVGTNGKTSTTLMTAALLRAAGLRDGAYISPHVARLGRADPGRRRPTPTSRRRSPASGRTPRARRSSRCSPPPRSPSSPRAAVDAAVVEAGLGGRLDATNVLDARVVVLTNVALEHTEVLGATREEIAAEKLAVVTPGRSRRPRRAASGRASRGRPAPARVEVVSALEPRARRRGRARPSSAARSIRPRPRRCRCPAGSSAASRAAARDLGRRAQPRRRRLPARRGSRRAATRSSPRSSPTRTPRRCSARSRRSATRSSRPRRRTRARSPPTELARARRAALRARRGGARSGRGARPRARARGAGRCRSCDRIALPARGAIARWLEPVQFRGPVGAPASSSSPSSCSPSTLGLRFAAGWLIGKFLL